MIKTKSLSLTSYVNLMLVTGVLAICACREPEKPAGKAVHQYNIEDTTSLKTVKWRRLNEFVSYHIIKEGTTVNDTGLRFTLRLLAFRYVINGVFDVSSKEDTPKNTAGTSNELLKKIMKQNEAASPKKNKASVFNPDLLSTFILSNKFSDRKAFDCLLKINSKINYKLEPWILKTITVIPKSENVDSIKLLVSKLNKENFSESVKAMKRPKSEMDGLMKLLNTHRNPFVVKIILNPAYRNLSDLPKICGQLKLWTDVKDAIYVSMFNDPSNYDSFFRLTSTK